MARSAALALAALLLLAAPATAAPDWTPAQRLPDPAAIPPWTQASSVRIQPDGTLTVGWAQLIGTSPLATRGGISSRQAGTGFGSELLLEDGSGHRPVSVFVDVGPEGTEAACVVEKTTTDIATAANRYTAYVRGPGAATWETAELFEDPERNPNSAQCQPYVGPDGSVVVLVRHDEDADPGVDPAEDDTLHAHLKRPGAAWTSQMITTFVSRNTNYGEGGFDANGNFVVVWTERVAGGTTADISDDRGQVSTRLLPAGATAFGDAQDLTELAGDAGGVDFSIAPDGAAVTSYQYLPTSGGNHRTFANVRSASGVWQGREEVSDSETGAPDAAAMSPDGTAYVLFSRSAPQGIALARRPIGGPWSEDHIVDGHTSIHRGAAGRLGQDVLFVFRGIAGGDQEALVGVRWRAGAPAPDPSKLLLPENTDAQLDGFDTDGVDSAAATVLIDSAAYMIGYDGAGPRLTATIPSVGTVGQPVGFGVASADLWSALAEPTWDFGDGGTATGTSPSHAYAQPGTYTVTVTQADALGNASSAQGVVTVSAPPGPGGGPDTTAPTVKLNKPRCKKAWSKPRCKRFRKSRRAWRTLRGRAADDRGAVSVKLRVKRPKKPVLTRTVQVVDGKWKSRLPKLTRGRHVFRATAVDAAGNRSAVARRNARLR